MKLNKLFEGAPDLEIDTLSIDSRKKTKNGLFFCLEGLQTDGHLYVEQAIKNGAVAICYNKEIANKNGAVFIKVNNVNKTLGRVASAFFDNPSKKISLIGTTGTHGKSSVSSIVKDLIDIGGNCGYIGALGITYNDINIKQSLSTPSVIELNYYFNEMINNGCVACSMEVSSIGIDQKRIEGLDFDVAAFTNFSENHTDYHASINDYFLAKKKFFDDLKTESLAVVNADDAYAGKIVEDCKANIVTYGIDNSADYMAYDIKLLPNETSFTLNARGRVYRIITNLVAKFNVYNVLCALAIVNEAGYDVEQLTKKLQHLRQIEGRLERLDLGQNFNCFIDFTHSITGLKYVFEFAKAITPKDSRIIAVFGCVGRRDTNKRQLIGELADNYSDLIILTEDDPKDENVFEIINDIEAGITSKNHLIIEDRKEAINMAVSMMNAHDTLLILGKGNECFIERKNGRDEYDGDVEIAKDAIRDLLIN